MSVNWSYFDKFEKVNNMYLPDYGEGETKATMEMCLIIHII